MLDEELEFYGWLEEQPEFAGADDSVVDAQCTRSQRSAAALAYGATRRRSRAGGTGPTWIFSNISALGRGGRRVARDRMSGRRTTLAAPPRSGIQGSERRERMRTMKAK
jgi:hypothetical protein